MLVDSHTHLHFPTSSRKAGLRGTGVEDLNGAIVRAKEAGVGKIITVGTTIEESKKAIGIADKLSTEDLAIYSSVGIHPKDGRADVEKFGLSHCFETLKQMASSSKRVVAIGECGLDYYLGTNDKEKEFQGKLFKGQIKLATDLGLPLIVHCRNGWDEIFRLLSIFAHRAPRPAGMSASLRIHTSEYMEYLLAHVNLKTIPRPFRPRKFIVDRQSSIKGVFHSWTGDWNAAQKALDLGFYISFSGIVTFKNAPKVQEVAKKAPIERILIETDSPFLAPEPFRGSKNEPKNVRITAQFLAKTRGLPFDKIAEATTQNAGKLFGL